jgi:hypothetical protein
MKKQGQRRDTPPAVRRAEFMKNPAKVVERAKVEGTIAITDGEGRARLLICIPTDERTDSVR